MERRRAAVQSLLASANAATGLLAAIAAQAGSLGLILFGAVRTTGTESTQSTLGRD